MSMDLWAGDGRCGLCGETITDTEGEIHGNIDRDGRLRCFKFGEYAARPAAKMTIEGVDMVNKTVTIDKDPI